MSTEGETLQVSVLGQKFGVSVPLLTCSPSAWLPRLLYRRGRKSRRGLWITPYRKSLKISQIRSFGLPHYFLKCFLPLSL